MFFTLTAVRSLSKKSGKSQMLVNAANAPFATKVAIVAISCIPLVLGLVAVLLL